MANTENQRKKAEHKFLRRIVKKYSFDEVNKFPVYIQTLTLKELRRVMANKAAFPYLLSEFDFIDFLSENEYIKVIEVTDESVTFEVSERQRLIALFQRAEIRLLHEGEPALVAYNPHSGSIDFNGIKKRLKGRNKKIFTVLYNRANQDVEKGNVWRAAGRRGKPNGLDDTWTFNSYITNLRRSLGGASPSQIRLNKTVQLWAYIELTEENDLNSEENSLK